MLVGSFSAAHLSQGPEVFSKGISGRLQGSYPSIPFSPLFCWPVLVIENVFIAAPEAGRVCDVDEVMAEGLGSSLAPPTHLHRGFFFPVFVYFSLTYVHLFSICHPFFQHLAFRVHPPASFILCLFFINLD